MPRVLAELVESVEGSRRVVPPQVRWNGTGAAGLDESTCTRLRGHCFITFLSAQIGLGCILATGIAAVLTRALAVSSTAAKLRVAVKLEIKVGYSRGHSREVTRECLDVGVFHSCVRSFF